MQQELALPHETQQALDDFQRMASATGVDIDSWVVGDLVTSSRSGRPAQQEVGFLRAIDYLCQRSPDLLPPSSQAPVQRAPSHRSLWRPTGPYRCSLGGVTFEVPTCPNSHFARWLGGVFRAYLRSGN